MVIDHAGGLHVGVADRGTDKFEAALFEVFTKGIGFGTGGRVVFHGAEFVDDGGSIDKAPDIGIKGAESFLDFKKVFGVVDGGFDFGPITDDAGVLEEGCDFALIVAGDFFGLEMIEGFTEIFAFSENGVPA